MAFGIGWLHVKVALILSTDPPEPARKENGNFDDLIVPRT